MAHLLGSKRNLLNKKEQLALEVIIAPSTETVRELTHRVAQYMLAVAHSTSVTRTDRPRRDELRRTLENSPDREYITVVTGKRGDSTLPPTGSPTNQDERWTVLQQYRDYLDNDPRSFEDHFFRAIYAMSATLMLKDFIRLGISHVNSAPRAQSKYFGNVWRELMEKEKENPKAYRRAWAARNAELQEEVRSPIVLDAQKSTYELLDAVLSTEKPPSPIVITPASTHGLVNSDNASLNLREFSVQVDWETFYWKVKSVEMSRLQIRFFWVQFSSIPDGESPTAEEVSMMLEEDNAGSQIRVNEADFTRLLLRSDMY